MYSFSHAIYNFFLFDDVPFRVHLGATRFALLLVPFRKKDIAVAALSCATMTLACIHTKATPEPVKMSSLVK